MVGAAAALSGQNCHLPLILSLAAAPALGGDEEETGGMGKTMRRRSRKEGGLAKEKAGGN